ncbi:hypothetical protein M409DRAFT_17756 [Zasmidium cellare ATCC 36951]|uniref:Uncharacterized protein n=1 Tax=Zasmidium cellare ATCC 36951 TaxID=1080233 RepID=A0A6A6D0I5_ZASCE|nr:uncharacterized protein M409DRAFT_17756 [Zasmidium cellare ATCC 36951]KAF2172523.1 hypothetical protein M409DRAFT_17756 [Zasmidium cellare ATCC 36951]
MTAPQSKKPDEPVGNDSMDSDNETASRTSADVQRHDRDTIETEEEAERSLAGDPEKTQDVGGLAHIFRRDGNEGDHKRSRRRQRKAGRRSRGGNDESELLYKVEEGGRSSSAESSANSSEADLGRIRQVHAKRKSSKCSRVSRFAAIFVGITVAFLALLFGAYKATRSTETVEETKPTTIAKTMSNGTHEFAPTTILISLDGFRADFLHRGLTPTLGSFIKQGVSPKYMNPSFPSLTFPNHFTLVTGMHPESHGIVGNTFWDPIMAQGFTYHDPTKSMKPEYWNAEPIWETAELQDVRSAIHMWPGSEAHIGTKEPAFVDKYKGDEKLENKVARVLGWLDLPGPNDPGASAETPRPQLILKYVPNVDSDGHAYGPNSTYIRSTIAEVDGVLGALFSGLEERNLTNIVNVVVVSDHGMATTSNQRLIQLEDLLDPDLIEHIDGWPLYGLRPKDQSKEQLEKLYQELLSKADLPQYKGSFDVYLRDKNMPERYHFTKNNRIAPLWIVPNPGWAVVTKGEFNIEDALSKDEDYNPRGLHGYDNENPLMRAIFIARGPAFPHAEGSQVVPFQNIEVYNIICDSLGIEPKPNNGTIRLPFKTIGLHDPNEHPDIPDDPPDVDFGAQLLPPDLPGVENLPPPTIQGSDPPPAAENGQDEAFNPTPSNDRPVVEDGESQDEQDKSWVEWINGKLKDVKVWATGLFGGTKEDPQEAEETRHGEDW